MNGFAGVLKSEGENNYLINKQYRPLNKNLFADCDKIVIELFEKKGNR